MTHANTLRQMMMAYTSTGMYADRYAALLAGAETLEAQELYPRAEWHEDYGPVLWWSFPIEEQPYAGTPLDYKFPECMTHWTRIVLPEPPKGE